MTRTGLLVAAAIMHATSLAACGDDEPMTAMTPQDGGAGADLDGGSDGGPASDAGSDGGAGDGGAGDGGAGDGGSDEACDTFIRPISQIAFEDPGLVTYEGRNAETAPYDAINVQVVYENGGSSSPFTTTTWDNYETCAACVLILEDCELPGTEADCRTFLAFDGTLTITENENGVGAGRFAGNLEEMTFREVTIDPTTFVSQPVPGGETRCVSSFEFSVTTTGL